MNTATAAPTTDPPSPHGDHEIDHEMEHAARSRLRMGWGQRSVVALLLTIVIVPPMAGFYSYFSGVPLHLLAGKQEDEGGDDAALFSSIALVPALAHTLE